jgi:hypothetical protein
MTVPASYPPIAWPAIATGKKLDGLGSKQNVCGGLRQSDLIDRMVLSFLGCCRVSLETAAHEHYDDSATGIAPGIVFI